MPVTIPLPPDVEADFQNEARSRGLDAEAYTRFAMDTAAEAFEANPPADEHEMLLIMSRLENELPREWKKADELARLKYAGVLCLVWLLAKPERLNWLISALSSAANARRSVSGRSTPTLGELKAMPKAEREAVMRAQAENAEPLYTVDLALPARDRELTAFTVLDDYDAVIEPEEYAAVAG